jgi:hypothetical protein
MKLAQHERFWELQGSKDIVIVKGLNVVQISKI